MEQNTETRVCRKCGEEKPITTFRYINSPKYRSHTCNACNYKHCKERGRHMYAIKYREKWNEYQREYAKRRRREAKEKSLSTQ